MGGTLWPNSGDVPDWPERRIAAVSSLGLDREEAVRLIEALVEIAGLPRVDNVQRTLHETEDALRRLGLADRVRAADAARAMCLPARHRFPGFDGSTELLAGASELGLRVIVVSNVVWRSRREYARDFEDLGCGAYVDGIVTSIDTGYAKPHPAMFEEAVELAGCAPAECIHFGDKEDKDIEPASAMGMRTVLVAIEEPPPATTKADAVVTDLHDALQVLRSFAS